MQSISERKKDILYRELCERLPYDIRCFVPVYDEVMTLMERGLIISVFIGMSLAWIIGTR